MRYYTTLFLLLSWSLSAKVNAQDVDPKLAEALQHALDSMYAQLDIYGISAAVQLPNDVVWAGGSGVSTLQPLDSITPEHRFASGSSTKTVTSMCIMQLADEGVLQLDDSLHQWLPFMLHINPNITIRQLLQHQSGLFDFLYHPNFQPSMLQNVNQLWSLGVVMNSFMNSPNFAPGTSWEYSNTNFILLGMIIEAATGNTYHEEFQNRFFEPYNLESFVNLAYDPLPAEVAHLWLDLDGNGQLDDAHNFFTGWKSMFSVTGPAGGYFTQPRDMAKWMRLSMSGSLCSADLWEEASTTIPSTLPGNTQYGLGLTRQSFLGLTSFGHGGDLSYSTSAFYFPEKDISIAVQANDASINSWNLRPVIRALLGTYLECEPLISGSSAPSILEGSRVYPNPMSNASVFRFNLTSAVDDLELNLIAPTGQVVRAAKYQNLQPGKHELPVKTPAGLPDGMYYLQAIADKRQTAYQKVLITHH